MKINDYKVGTTFEITCTKSIKPQTNEIVYDSFCINKKYASIYGRKPEDVITVKCTIIEEDVIINDLMPRNSNYDTNSIDYFGWIDMENKNDYNISLIYANIKLYFVCFAYGPDAGRFWQFDRLSDDNKTYLFRKGDRRGMTVRLKIEEI